jgi:hypothetical protein
MSCANNTAERWSRYHREVMKRRCDCREAHSYNNDKLHNL